MRRLIGALAFTSSIAWAAPAHADALEIGPVRVTMVGEERTATITIRNVDSDPTDVQIRTLDWTQADGTDAYVASAVLLASPPAAQIAPGEAQVVRLVIEHVPDVRNERAFRLVIDQLPRQASTNGAGVQAAIRALVPVFLSPSLDARPSLSWQARRQGANMVLTATNSGAVHDRLLDLAVSVGGQPVTPVPLEGYILSGASRSWVIVGVPASAGSVKVTGEGDWAPVEADVPIAP